MLLFIIIIIINDNKVICGKHSQLNESGNNLSKLIINQVDQMIMCKLNIYIKLWNLTIKL